MQKHGSKKRKRHELSPTVRSDGVDTSKPTAVFKPKKGRNTTFSVALPGSIIANAQTHDQKTALAGQVARALAVFCVDEIIIFDDGTRRASHQRDHGLHLKADTESGYTAFANPDHFLYHVLSYLETPQYLRRALFPHHPNLRTAGVLPSLDMPHHLRSDEWCQYREGVSAKTEEYSANGTSISQQSYVNAGFSYPVKVFATIPSNTRVTLKFLSPDAPSTMEKITAEAVSPDAPREESGYYWGYNARLASSLSTVFTECPYENGYDYSVGTSERGRQLNSLNNPNERSKRVPKWKHLLLAFGGPAGLEKAVANDQALMEKGVVEPSELFDAWINLVEGQGSRTIRTEEALWIGLMGTRDFVKSNEA